MGQEIWTPFTGYIQILEVIEMRGISSAHFPGLESPGIGPRSWKVMENYVENHGIRPRPWKVIENHAESRGKCIVVARNSDIFCA